MDIEVFADGRVVHGGRTYAASLGRAGILRDKHEGDGATPAGRWPLRRVLYRADRLPAPPGPLPVQAIRPEDGWCDAPDHPAYNRLVAKPFAASHEDLWREDHLYDLVVVVGHNDDPPVPGRGSAIFMHLKRDDGGLTAGCVGLRQDDLVELLGRLSADSCLRVHAAG
ncbi:L,D-transpeptidase family protein [Zavarzinia compransoris]|uniref:L,D-TPase catalytic domain-containing protein n=1 Tax=Zavarzinia compransoris TaxID=1264899 RepID=A0A317E0D2_9PROT|nr:L,D-transpeptidase family protein [Zavarzinia compransoris]PWR20518.1 hypothetical protein DKG75_10950 [Zavarzinia compransoris]TDP43837.1 L,D-peptidoglycan transpeptidase YkuD (ErfK/YbiS/YcfS/YnhG family) [Zavarzinia compransoris]